ncbi:hypothetical protein D3C73_858120 [compost metagenome]
MVGIPSHARMATQITSQDSTVGVPETINPKLSKQSLQLDLGHARLQSNTGEQVLDHVHRHADNEIFPTCVLMTLNLAKDELEGFCWVNVRMR